MNEYHSFIVKVTKPGIYRLETSGLLATNGILRTRVITSLIRQQGGGEGRNFLIQQYLRAGDYFITVNPIGNSAGHLGLHLTASDPTDGGLLTSRTSSSCRFNTF
ncbi:MAG: hypothetical protein JW841_11555 [Deltaproteobacteria bacterium]|nr:hypothetical protein [Deltaproteobacteria bacterium]